MFGRVTFVWALCVVLLPAVSNLRADDAPTPGEQSTDSGAFTIPEKEKPFWESAQKFLDGYAARDAAAIGALFTEDAEVYDEFGELTVGREAIVGMYREVFDEYPDALIDEINLEKVRYITDNVVIEEGRVVSQPGDGGSSIRSRYVAIHVKESDGVWRIDMLKDFAQEGLDRGEHLAQLSWLVGEWVSEDDESVVHTECRWSDDGNYLLRKFTVRIGGEDLMQGEQRIGWDPAQKLIRSWMFESEGGFAEATWQQNGNQWIVVMNGTNAEGQPASATAIFTIIDEEMLSWQYRNLVIGNEIREDIEPIVLMRRPPAPATAANQ